MSDTYASEPGKAKGGRRPGPVYERIAALKVGKTTYVTQHSVAKNAVERMRDTHPDREYSREGAEGGTIVKRLK